ncbi:MAG: hypothetical protein NT014_06350 [Candidatus Omnitrophica bacterium]|nr:hypothetical protein [Candidatus Omnitrophota bacterium]
MKRLLSVLVVLGFLAMNSSSVFAEWFAKGEAEQKTAAPVVKKLNSKTQDMVAKKKLELNGTEWAIETKAMSGKGKTEKDVVSFIDGKVSSKNMVVRGFEATNFSMRLLEDGETYTWETMQVSEKEGAAFWRGDIGSDGIMRGVLSIRDKKNRVSDFNFYSLASNKAAVVPPPAAVVEPIPAVVEPAASEAVINQ